MTNEESQPLQCFVIMPSGTKNEYADGPEESDHVYEQLFCRALAIAGESIGRPIQPTRETDRKAAGVITRAIVRSLYEADFVVADITGSNPNVFFELGVRYSLRRDGTFLTCCAGKSIPFDISGLRTVFYKPYKAEAAAETLAEFIVNTHEHRRGARTSGERPTDSLVYESIDGLEVFVNGIQADIPRSAGRLERLSWEEIMHRVKSLDFYGQEFASSRFVPDAIIGISNGGTLVAEVISRKYFPGIPLVSLWAERRKEPERRAAGFFDNPYARAAVTPLRGLADERQSPVILLVIDDNAATGETGRQALRFLEQEIGNVRVLFQPLVFRTKHFVKKLQGSLPPDFASNVFQLDDNEFWDRLITTKSHLPYEKAIR